MSVKAAAGYREDNSQLYNINIATGSPSQALPLEFCVEPTHLNIGRSASAPVTKMVAHTEATKLANFIISAMTNKNNTNTNVNVSQVKTDKETAPFAGKYQAAWVKPEITDKTGNIDQTPPYIYAAIEIASLFPAEIKKLMASQNISENEAIVTLFCRDWAARKGFEVINLQTEAS